MHIRAPVQAKIGYGASHPHPLGGSEDLIFSHVAIDSSFLSASCEAVMFFARICITQAKKHHDIIGTSASALALDEAL